MNALLLMVLAAPTAQLTYVVPQDLDSCPDERWVRAAVSARLGRDPFVDASPTRVQVSLSRGPAPALMAVVEVVRPDGRVGRRTIDSPTGDCLELASAVELAVSLALDPSSRRAGVDAGTPATPPEGDAGVATTAADAGSRATALDGGSTGSVERDERPPQLEPIGRIGVLGTAGGLPGFTGALLLGGGFRLPHFSVALEGRLHLPTLVEAGGASTLQVLASLVPCLEVGRFSGCLVGSAGPFFFDDGVSRITTLMGQVGVRAGLRFSPASWVNVVPWLESTVIVTRTTFWRDQNLVWVSWPLSISGGVFVEFSGSS